MGCKLDEIRTFRNEIGDITIFVYPSARLSAYVFLNGDDEPLILSTFRCRADEISAIAAENHWTSQNDKEARKIEAIDHDCKLDEILTYWSKDTRNRVIVHPSASDNEQDVELVHIGVADNAVAVSFYRSADSDTHTRMYAAGYWRCMNDEIERMDSERLTLWLAFYINTNHDGIHEDRISAINAEINVRASAALQALYRTI
jgi:hypothetical protein